MHDGAISSAINSLGHELHAWSHITGSVTEGMNRAEVSGGHSEESATHSRRPVLGRWVGEGGQGRTGLVKQNGQTKGAKVTDIGDS